MADDIGTPPEGNSGDEEDPTQQPPNTPAPTSAPTSGNSGDEDNFTPQRPITPAPVNVNAEIPFWQAFDSSVIQQATAELTISGRGQPSLSSDDFDQLYQLLKAWKPEVTMSHWEKLFKRRKEQSGRGQNGNAQIKIRDGIRNSIKKAREAKAKEVADAKDTEATEAKAKEAELEEAELEEAELEEAELEEAELEEAELEEAELEEAELEEAELEEAELEEAELKEAELKEAEAKEAATKEAATDTSD